MELTKDEILQSEEGSKAEVILFVCVGNTCRSPMCAALFNSKYAKPGQIGISAGTEASSGHISSYAVAALKKAGIFPTEANNYTEHFPLQIDQEVVSRAEKIICVTSRIAMTLMMTYPAYAPKITSFKHDIFDPYGGDDVTYDHCLTLIDKEMEILFG